MRALVPKLLIVPVAAIALGVVAASAAAAPTISGTIELKSELGTNNKITPGPDGNVWVTI